MKSRINLIKRFLFKNGGEALYHGKKVRREIAEVPVVLDGAHKTRVNGKQREIKGGPLSLRAVFVRILDEDDHILAEWILLTNVPASEAETATIATWYYYRWRIESFFKLLKSAGYELEYWRQETGKGIINRLLIASMACVYVWQLQQDKSQEAAILRSHLMKLSGRRTSMESNRQSLRY